MLAGAVKSAVDYAANRFVTKAVTQMLALLTPAGAVASLLKKLYDAVVWFLGNRALLGELWDKLKSLFQAATGGLQASAIRDRVEEFLKAGLPTLLSGLAALVGLGDARKKVGEAVRKTSEAFWSPVESLLEKIAAPIKRQWQKLTEKLSGADPVAPPSQEGDKTVWYDRTQKKVLVQQGLAPAQPVEQFKAAKGEDVEKAAQVLERAGDKYVEELTSAGNDGTKVRQALAKQSDVEEKQQELAKLLGSCPLQTASVAQGSCFVAGTSVHTADGPRPIEQVRLLAPVCTFADAERRAPAPPAWRPDPARDRRVSFVLTRPDGQTVEIELVRSLAWLTAHGAETGGTVHLDLPEMAAVGAAQVTALGPCPPFDAGAADDPSVRYVTGRFRHTSGRVYDLKFQGEEAPIGATGTHPFWSVDRGGWTAAAELAASEQVQTRDGSIELESRNLRYAPEPVYNLEIERDHCYRVGKSGVLVHNDSAPCDYCAQNNFDYQSTPPGGGTWTSYVVKKCDGNTAGVQNPHGHHIVMKGVRFDENAKARQILCKYGINPYTDCENLVISRNYCHSHRYAKTVLAALETADRPTATKEDIEEVLRTMAKWHARCNDEGKVDPNSDDA